jgi:hypothetical protein
MKTTASIETSRDIEEVFEFLSQPAKVFVPKSNRFTFEEGPKQLGVGTVFTATMRIGPMKTVFEYRVVDYYRPQRIAYEIAGLLPGRSGLRDVFRIRKKEPPPMLDTFELERAAGGTVIKRTMDYPGWFLWAMIPFFSGPIGRAMMLRDLRKLKHRVESEASNA